MRLTESHDHDMLTELAGRDDPDPTWLRSPIGLWGVREILLEEGVPRAPLVGRAGRGAHRVRLRALAEARREVAEAELTAWVAAPAARGKAADGLARLLHQTDGTAHRALALYALRCNGGRRDGARTRDESSHYIAGPRPQGQTGSAIRARDAAGR